MIKFFRKIRLDALLPAGKAGSRKRFPKYFTYAIGEILLVVIGILIALQINNWNENQKNSREEQLVLKQLKAEFQINLSQIEDKIRLRKFLVNSGYEILNYVDNPDEIPSEKKFDSILAYTLPAPTFNPTNGVTNDLINSGRLYIIKNDSLRQLISGWSGDIDNSLEEEYIWKEHRDRDYLPFIKQNYSARSVMNSIFTSSKIVNIIDFGKNSDQESSFGNSKKIIDLKSFVINSDLEDYIADMLVFNKIAQRQSFALKKKVHMIISLINSEIDD